MKNLKNILSIIGIVVILVLAFVGNAKYANQHRQDDDILGVQNKDVQSTNSQNYNGNESSQENSAEAGNAFEITRLEEDELPTPDLYYKFVSMSDDTFFAVQTGKVGEEINFYKNSLRMNFEFIECRFSVKVNEFEVTEEGDYKVDFVINSYNEEDVVFDWRSTFYLMYLDEDARVPQEVEDERDMDLYKYYKGGNVLNTDEVQFLNRPNSKTNYFTPTDEVKENCVFQPGENHFILLYKRPEGFEEIEGYSWCLTTLSAHKTTKGGERFKNGDFAIRLE